jgi:hypothetical protein
MKLNHMLIPFTPKTVARSQEFRANATCAGVKGISILNHYLAAICLAAGLTLQLMCISSTAQTAAAPSLPPGVQDVVKLVQAGLGEEVILAHIRNAGAYYNLSADQIIYLHNQNVTQNEISALLGPSGTAAPAPPLLLRLHLPRRQWRKFRFRRPLRLPPLRPPCMLLLR